MTTLWGPVRSACSPGRDGPHSDAGPERAYTSPIWYTPS